MPTNKKKKGKGKKKASTNRGSGCSASAETCSNGRASTSNSGAIGTVNRGVRAQNPFAPTPPDEAQPVGPPVESSAESDPVPAPKGATCWICLEGPDDADADIANKEPLRRDCACRGTSSGYAHLTCLAKYSASCSEEIWIGKREVLPGGNNLAFGRPWEYCSNCKKNFSGQLRIDIAYEFVRSTESMIPCVANGAVGAWPRAFRHLVARCWVTKSLMGDRLCDARIDQARDEYQTLFGLFHSFRDNGVFIGLSPIMGLFRTHMDQLEAESWCNYGQLLYTDSSLKTQKRGGNNGQRVDSLEKGQMEEAIRAQEKALYIFQRLPASETAVIHINATLSGMRREMQAIDMDNEISVSEEEMLRLSKNMVAAKRTELGENSTHTMRAENMHIQKLIRANKIYEAADLVRKLAVKCRRELGPDHVQTECALDSHRRLQERSGTLSRDRSTVVSILRYDEKSDLYTIHRQDDLDQEVSPTDLILKRGAAVKCVSLKGATHLNGRRGQVVKYNEGTERHMVTFPEEVGIDDCLVKPANLRVVFFDDI